MKHLKILNYFILGLVLAGVGAAVQAAEVGQGYLSLYVGEAEVDFDINNVNVEADDTSFRIGGGYRVSEREPLALDYRGRRLLTNPAPALGGPRCYIASAAEIISISSLVITAWRVRL